MESNFVDPDELHPFSEVQRPLNTSSNDGRKRFSKEGTSRLGSQCHFYLRLVYDTNVELKLQHVIMGFSSKSKKLIAPKFAALL